MVRFLLAFRPFPLPLSCYWPVRHTAWQLLPSLTHRVSDQNIPFPDSTFDAVYAIEATVHAPSLAGVYSEIRRVLKPGGVFGVYEWVMTDAYDASNLIHRQIRLDIEQGDGISNMVTASEALAAFAEAGLELLETEDLAQAESYGGPWYWPLAGTWKHVQNLWDLATMFRMTRIGRVVTHAMITALETVRLAPPGTAKMSASLQVAARALVWGGQNELFTPMLLMVGRKPAKNETK
jgi:sterol 24-C-methyltransferase